MKFQVREGHTENRMGSKFCRAFICKCKGFSFMTSSKMQKCKMWKRKREQSIDTDGHYCWASKFITEVQIMNCIHTGQMFVTFKFFNLKYVSLLYLIISLESETILDVRPIWKLIFWYLAAPHFEETKWAKIGVSPESIIIRFDACTGHSIELKKFTTTVRCFDTENLCSWGYRCDMWVESVACTLLLHFTSTVSAENFSNIELFLFKE